ncbi:hypothetical protein Lalb_Chr03g0037071 [Lupinus albus]|uniref:Uncharacterized protein n=1 Tax=Lupinus albus TaxID=3870 RepID=A0A6A4QU50_LUPAL|nr:hypothetical protein Lalb_Chr03g0037071 [Lupinus albus]
MHIYLSYASVMTNLQSTLCLTLSFTEKSNILRLIIMLFERGFNKVWSTFSLFHPVYN